MTSFQTPSTNYPEIRGVSLREGSIPAPYTSSGNLPYPPSHSHELHSNNQSYHDYYGDTRRESGIPGIQQPSLPRHTDYPSRAEIPTPQPKRASTYSSSIPLGLTNSNRATESQIKARRRIHQNQQKFALEENLPRKVLNYSKGKDGDVR